MEEEQEQEEEVRVVEGLQRSDESVACVRPFVCSALPLFFFSFVSSFHALLCCPLSLVSLFPQLSAFSFDSFFLWLLSAARGWSNALP